MGEYHSSNKNVVRRKQAINAATATATATASTKEKTERIERKPERIVSRDLNDVINQGIAIPRPEEAQSKKSIIKSSPPHPIEDLGRSRECNDENSRDELNVQRPKKVLRTPEIDSGASSPRSQHKRFRSLRKAALSPKITGSPTSDLESRGLVRTRSLVKPERARRHNLQHLGGVPTSPTHFETDPLSRPHQYTPWITFAYIVTFYAPDFILSRCGMKEKRVQVAWREKMALVTIIVALCAILAFITFGFQASVCGDPERLFRADEFNPSVVNIRGDLYDVRNWAHPGNLNMDGVKGRDVSWLFPVQDSVCPDVSVTSMKVQCTVTDAPDWAKLRPYCHTATEFAETRKTLRMVGHSSYTWEDVQLGQRLVYNK